MRYLRVDVGARSENRVPWWVAIMEKVLPPGNPDLEELHELVDYYWLEIDDAGAPQREIGFGSNGNAVVVGPVGENVGVLVDSSDDWSTSPADSEEAAEDFERVWRETWPRFGHLETP